MNYRVNVERLCPAVAAITRLDRFFSRSSPSTTPVPSTTGTAARSDVRGTSERRHRLCERARRPYTHTHTHRTDGILRCSSSYTRTHTHTFTNCFAVAFGRVVFLRCSYVTTSTSCSRDTTSNGHNGDAVVEHFVPSTHTTRIRARERIDDKPLQREASISSTIIFFMFHNE